MLDRIRSLSLAYKVTVLQLASLACALAIAISAWWALRMQQQMAESLYKDQVLGSVQLMEFQRNMEEYLRPQAESLFGLLLVMIRTTSIELLWMSEVNLRESRSK